MKNNFLKQIYLRDYMHDKMLVLMKEFYEEQDSRILGEIYNFVDRLSNMDEMNAFITSCERLLGTISDETPTGMEMHKIINSHMLFRLYSRIKENNEYKDIASRAELVSKYFGM